MAKRTVKAKTFIEKYADGEIENASFICIEGYAAIEMSGKVQNGDTYFASVDKDKAGEVALLAMGMTKRK